MRTGRVATVILTTALCLGPANPGLAAERGAGPPGDPAGIAGRAAWHGGFHGYGGVGVFVGPGGWWGGPGWWGAPYPYYADPYYYAAPPGVVPEAPPVYAQAAPPAPPPAYWYYCQNPPGYYPYIKDCPAGWLTVVPPMGAGRPGPQQIQPLGGPGPVVVPPMGAGRPGPPETRPSVFAYQVPLLTLILAHGQELGLTPEQLQKLQELRTTFDKEAVARGVAIRAAEADLKGLLEKDQWDLTAIEAKVQQLATLQGDLRFAGIKTLAAGEALLTPEQVQKLEAIGQWTPPPGGPERAGPRPPSGPGGPPAPQP